MRSPRISRALAGGRLHFYDAIAPIVAADSIDLTIAYAKSRYGKGGGDDYLNLPFDEAQYRAFVAALLAGEKVLAHDFEEPRYFEGCLPIEVMAERGADVLAYGPMKPVGLEDPRTGRRPHAVVQLRREDVDGHGVEPGRLPDAAHLAGAEADLPRASCRASRTPSSCGSARSTGTPSSTRRACSRPTSPARSRPHLFFAGQITGVEGYVESAACGHLAARAVLDRLAGRAVPAAARGDRDRARSTGTSPARRTRRATSTSRRTSCSRCSRRSRGGTAARQARKEAHAERARREIEPWIEQRRRSRRRVTRGALIVAVARRPPRSRWRLSRAEGAPTSRGLGARVAEGPVRARDGARADGAWLALLDGVQRRARPVPAAGHRELRARASRRPRAASAPASRRAVTTLPHGFAWAPSGDAPRGARASTTT